MDAANIVAKLLESDDDFDAKAFLARNFKALEEPSKKHLFVSSADGGLYDTRKPDWHKGPPLRQNFQQYHARIFNVKDFKATWRARGFSNYPLAFIMSDGEAMCEKCVAREPSPDHRLNQAAEQRRWAVVGVSACHGGDDAEEGTQCAQCNKNLGELG
jgi:hypothetical protein